MTSILPLASLSSCRKTSSTICYFIFYFFSIFWGYIHENLYLLLVKQIKPQFYAFRWITLLLTQEFNLQPILRIWDTLLSNPFGIQVFVSETQCAGGLKLKIILLPVDLVFLAHFCLRITWVWSNADLSAILYFMQHMLLRVCCAMLLCMKNRLLSGDFVANLQLLQHYPDVNIEHLLQVARDLSPDTSSCSLSP